jgi:hypothetical protein
MKYPNWRRVGGDSSVAKEWEYKEDDITVEIHKEISGDGWFVDASDSSGKMIFGDSSDIGTRMDTKRKAETVALGLLDSINAVYQMKTFTGIDDEPVVSGRKSPRELVKEYVEVTIPEGVDETDVEKGYWSGAVIIGYGTDERPVMEFQRAFLDYHLSQHYIEPETFGRWDVVGGSGGDDKKSYYEKPLNRSSWAKIDLDDIDTETCEECGEELGSNSGDCESCAEAVREAEEAVSEMRGY